MPIITPADLSGFLLCLMPGLVIDVLVSARDKVEMGQTLAIVEAVKMEYILVAEKAGIVKSVPVARGDTLQVDDIIMEFET